MANVKAKIAQIEPTYQEFIDNGGVTPLWAISLEYIPADMSHRIVKVEPWSAYDTINALQRNIYRVMARDELEAYSKMLDHLRKGGM